MFLTTTLHCLSVNDIRQEVLLHSKKLLFWDFPGGTVNENSSANAGDTGSIPGPGRFHMPWGN